MVNVRQDLVSSDKYWCKCPYTMTPQGITVHNTANDASARNEINYMKTNNNEVSYHYGIDDIEIVQGIPENRNAWHSGDGTNGFGNRNTIAIEICYSRSGGERFDIAERNCAEFVASLLKKYGWGIDKVYTHNQFDRYKKYCPHRTLDKGWQRFLDMVKVFLEPQREEIATEHMGHIQNKGWENIKSCGEWSGTLGEGLRLEAYTLKIVTDNMGLQKKLKFQAHIQDIGDTDIVCGTGIIGTMNNGKRMESVRFWIEDENYDICYRTHSANVGDSKWVENGAWTNEKGIKNEIQAIQVVIYKK